MLPFHVPVLYAVRSVLIVVDVVGPGVGRLLVYGCAVMSLGEKKVFTVGIPRYVSRQLHAFTLGIILGAYDDCAHRRDLHEHVAAVVLGGQRR